MRSLSIFFFKLNQSIRSVQEKGIKRLTIPEPLTIWSQGQGGQGHSHLWTRICKAAPQNLWGPLGRKWVFQKTPTAPPRGPRSLIPVVNLPGLRHTWKMGKAHFRVSP